uniref:DUF4371 domain-containing protein n=1 Tax=Romanomermis culicivorax TaxID=13658 RepID=A0A915IN56_ROMCU
MRVNEENNEVNQINLSDEETEQQDKNSTKNPVALNPQYGFKHIWLKKFLWLKIASFDEKKVYCDFCKSEKVNTIWSLSKILPTWRIDAFNYHEQKDKDHAKAVAAIKTRPLNAIKTAAKVVQQKDGEAVIRIIRKVLFVVQHNQPISTSTDLHTFLRYLGETSSNSNIIVNSNKSNFLMYQFLKAIDASLFQAIITRLCESICCTLHVDELKDIMEQKHLMLYATLWNAGNCSTVTTFLAIFHIKQADSKSLCQKITEFFVGNGVNLKKMTEFTSDGASVMLGVKKSVAQRLKNDEGIAHLIDSHCVTHKEALAMKDVLNVYIFILNIICVLIVNYL